jgi:hypothetical protein
MHSVHHDTSGLNAWHEWHSVKVSPRGMKRRRRKSHWRAGLRARSTPQADAAPNRPCGRRSFVPEALVLSMLDLQQQPLRESDLLRTQEVRAPGAFFCYRTPWALQ